MDCQSRDLWTNLGRITSIDLSVCKIYMYRRTVRGRLFDRGRGRRGWVLPYITHTLYKLCMYHPNGYGFYAVLV